MWAQFNIELDGYPASSWGVKRCNYTATGEIILCNYVNSFNVI